MAPSSYAAYMDDGSGFATNALRFETKEEAEGYARDLSMRWLSVKRWEVREVGEPVSHAWTGIDGLIDIRTHDNFQTKGG